MDQIDLMTWDFLGDENLCETHYAKEGYCDFIRSSYKGLSCFGQIALQGDIRGDMISRGFSTTANFET